MAVARPIKDLQDDIAERIADDDNLIGLHVISQDKGDIDAQVDQAVSGVAYGVFAIIEILTGATRSPSLGAFAMDLEVGITIEEHVTINRAQDGFLPWDYVLMALLTLFGPYGNANQALQLNGSGFEMQSDTGGVVRFQIKGKALCGWVRT